MDSYEQQQELEEYDRAKYQDTYPKEVMEEIKEHRGLLDQAFNLYSFSVLLNEENKTAVAETALYRVQEMKIAELAKERDLLRGEVMSVRTTTTSFKKSEETADKRI